LVEQCQLAFASGFAGHEITSAAASYSSQTPVGWRLQRPREQAFAEFGDLLAVLQQQGVAFDQIDTAGYAA